MMAYQVTYQDRKCCMRRRTRLILEKRRINVQPPIPRFALSVPLLMPSISEITLFYVGVFFAKENTSRSVWMRPCFQLRQVHPCVS